MTFISAIIQGTIQGIAEFLPISSSGHLSIFQYFTGQSGESGALFSVILHLGTLIAVVIAFWDTILKLIVEFFYMLADMVTLRFRFKNFTQERAMIIMLFVSLLPLALTFVLKDFFEQFSSDSDVIVEGVCLMLTGTMLFLADRCVKGRKTARDMRYKDAVLIGLAQAVLAPFPGLSRSGSTLSTGLLLGLSREFAFSFSFIMGIPTVCGAILLDLGDIMTESTTIGIPVIVAGLLTSVVFGLLSIWMVRLLIRTDRLSCFSYYTWTLGAIVAVLGAIEHLAGAPISGFIISQFK